MWRWRKAAAGFDIKAREDQDSDQSISEEEEEGDWAGSAISLGRAGDKGGMQVLSQLEILRDSYEPHPTEGEPISLEERKGGYLVDDEIENPFFAGDSSNPSPKISVAALSHQDEETVYLPTVASISHMDEELISDDEEIGSPFLRSARENVGGTWSETTWEAEALGCLNKNSRYSSSHGGGGRTKSKPKFMFRSHPCTRDLSLVVSGGNGSTSSKNIPQTDETDAAAENDTRLIINEKESNQPEKNIVPSELRYKHDSREHSVAEFLDCFNESNDHLQGSSKQENPQSLKPVLPRRTMVDQSHYAFGMSSAIDERPYLAFPGLSCGIYQKLQQVLKIEKERDMEYLKNTSVESSSSGKNERTCIYVRILTRSLEAKLIVCSCAFVGDGKKSHRENNWQMGMEDVAATLIVIFNPRVCSDVELEVGNLICIHPPWKEVQVKCKDEVMLLCSYFSLVQP